MDGYAYNPFTGEYMCPCPNGTNQYYSRYEGQVYCVPCPDTDTQERAWNPYMGQGYCICPQT